MPTPGSTGGVFPPLRTPIKDGLFLLLHKTDQGDPPPIFDSLQRPCCRNWLNRQLIAFTCRSRSRLRYLLSTPTFPLLTMGRVDQEPGWTVQMQKPCPCSKSNLKRRPNSCRKIKWTIQRIFASKNNASYYICEPIVF